MAAQRRPKRARDAVGTLSTAQFARAIGVSESSIKRWADEGALSVVRTQGGHRRIARAEAVRFVRESNLPLVHPGALGLGRLPAVARGAVAEAEPDRLVQWLVAGATAEVSGFLTTLYLRGRGVAAIVDGPIRMAMERIGERWHHSPDGIFVEHRATDLCIQWLSQLRAVVAPPDDAPVAVGGAPSGDPYVLPTLAVAAALETEGVRAVNLGPDTPMATMLLALERERPAIAWVSVSTEAARSALAHDLPLLTAATRAHGTRLVLGGRALDTNALDVPSDVHVGRSVGEIAAFARGLLAGDGTQRSRS